MASVKKSPLIIGFQGVEPDWKWLAEIQPAGIVLFTRNLESIDQVRELNRQIHSKLPGTFIAIDQEGGRVHRLRDILGPFPGPESMKDEQAAKENGFIMGQMLHHLGFDLNFAPVIDLDLSHRENALADRYLGKESSQVFQIAQAYIQGLHSAGIEGCLKHWPGLGSTKVDSHYELPTLAHSEEQWDENEGLIYKMFAEKGWANLPIMFAHCRIPFWENQVASLSQFSSQACRKLGFNGIFMTDDMEMKAIDQKQVPKLSLHCLEQGLDLAMICHSADLISQTAEHIRSAGLEKPGVEAFQSQLLSLESKAVQGTWERSWSNWQRLSEEATLKASKHAYLKA